MPCSEALAALGIISLDGQPSSVTETHHLDVASLGIFDVDLELAAFACVGAYGLAQLHSLAVILGFVQRWYVSYRLARWILCLALGYCSQYETWFAHHHPGTNAGVSAVFVYGKHVVAVCVLVIQLHGVAHVWYQAELFDLGFTNGKAVGRYL